jgi:hypothetical protein
MQLASQQQCCILYNLYLPAEMSECCSQTAAAAAAAMLLMLASSPACACHTRQPFAVHAVETLGSC